VQCSLQASKFGKLWRGKSRDYMTNVYPPWVWLVPRGWNCTALLYI